MTPKQRAAVELVRQAGWPPMVMDGGFPAWGVRIEHSAPEPYGPGGFMAHHWGRPTYTELRQLLLAGSKVFIRHAEAPWLNVRERPATLAQIQAFIAESEQRS